MKMDEGITVVKYSPDSRLLAVALLDSKAKLFYADTLKVNIGNSEAKGLNYQSCQYAVRSSISKTLCSQL